MSALDELQAQIDSCNHDRQLLREATALVRDFVGSIRPRPILIGVNDGSKDEHFYMSMAEDGRDTVLAAHERGDHAKLPRPKFDCPRCLDRLAAFRRRQERRMDVVTALGGHCAVCYRGVTARGARFVHRRGERSTITQMFQWSHEEIVTEAKANYALLCPSCAGKGGRRKVVEKERSAMAFGMAPRRAPRSDRGQKRGRRGA